MTKVSFVSECFFVFIKTSNFIFSADMFLSNRGDLSESHSLPHGSPSEDTNNDDSNPSLSTGKCIVKTSRFIFMAICVFVCAKSRFIVNA